jgi:hypothetical protein
MLVKITWEPKSKSDILDAGARVYMNFQPPAPSWERQLTSELKKKQYTYENF